MLSPMLIQYLVGICCLRWNPDAVDITLGDMVLDPAAGKERDVDVTVTLTESPGVLRAFKAYEVKRENAVLDVTTVEQLCAKLNDMLAITHRGIVSTSGFTDGAKQKAKHHGVELFELKPWTKPMEEQFPSFGMKGLPKNVLRFSQNLLCWVDSKFQLLTPNATVRFNIQPGDNILGADGKIHPVYKTFEDVAQAIMQRSTEILFPLEPAQTLLRTFPPQQAYAESLFLVRPPWPHTHTLDTGRDSLHIRVEETIVQVEAITVTGYLQWQTQIDTSLYYVLERVSDSEVFAGALVAQGTNDGEMFGFIISPSSETAGVHMIKLEEKHKNAIRKLKLAVRPEGCN